MTEPKAKRGRPPKVKTNAVQVETKAQTEARNEAQAQGRLKVLKANAVFDGEGGFYPVGHMFDAVDAAAEAMLKARGLAE